MRALFLLTFFLTCLLSFSSEKDLYLVFLRQPRAAKTLDKRSDPFWEFGSFGLTGCHSRNLMHPKNVHRLNGQDIGFIQTGFFGGVRGVRIVNIVTVESVVCHLDVCEVKWDPTNLPFKFSSSLLLLDNNGYYLSEDLKKMVNSVNRQTPVAKFSSKFRTRSFPVPENVKNDILLNFGALKKQSKAEDIVDFYWQAIGREPPVLDQDRSKTYEELLIKRSLYKRKISPKSQVPLK